MVKVPEVKASEVSDLKNWEADKPPKVVADPALTAAHVPSPLR